jgi:HAMP domain-containing protein
MRALAQFIVLAFLHLILACSFAARQWQATAVSDFRSVAGKWEGFVNSDDPRALQFDRVTLVIDEMGGCETAITRSITKMPVSYSTFDVFAEQTQLNVTDDKLTAKFEKGGQMTAQLYVDPASGERMLKAHGRNSKGFTYSADLKRSGEAAALK